MVIVLCGVARYLARYRIHKVPFPAKMCQLSSNRPVAQATFQIIAAQAVTNRQESSISSPWIRLRNRRLEVRILWGVLC